MASPGDDDHQVPTLDGDVRKVFNLNPTNHKIPPMNVVAIGRPGVGKSTLLNGLMGRRIFNAGVTKNGGRGMRVSIPSAETPGMVAWDTPGFEQDGDGKHGFESFAFLVRALTTAPEAKILYVMQENSGRVDDYDVAILQMLGAAAKETLVDLDDRFVLAVSKAPKGLTHRDLAEIADEVRCAIAGMPALYAIVAVEHGDVGRGSDKLLPIPGTLLLALHNCPVIRDGKAMARKLTPSNLELTA